MLKRQNLETPVVEVMRIDCTRLPAGRTVGETLELLRKQRPSERIIYFYVVDAGGRLQGVVPTRALIMSPPDRRVDEIMVKRTVALPATATVRDACELFALHRFLALPVVDEARHLLGVVDIELYTDELDQLSDTEARNDLFSAIGVYAGKEGETSSWTAFLRRAPWLGCNLAGGLICAATASAFQAELTRVVALALFIPVVLNLAESVSSQSVSLTLHRMHGQTPGRDFLVKASRRELVTGLLLGAGCGTVVGTTAWLWQGHSRLGLSLLFGITGGVIFSALLGMLLPVALRLLKLDPKVAAGPIALAGSDVATLFAYLGFARMWL
jgi:magnesium transporter